MKKSLLSLVMIIILLAGVLTGCTPAEKGMQSLYQETSNIDRYENTGEIAVSLNALPKDVATSMDPKDLALLKTTLNAYSLAFQGKVDMEKQVMQYDFYLKDKSTGSNQDLTTIIFSENTIYMKVTGLIKLASLMGDGKLDKELAKAFGDADYLAIPMDEFAKEITSSGSPGIVPMWGAGGNLLDQSAKQQDLILKLCSGLTDQVYDQYESGLVQKSGGKYVFSADPVNGVQWFMSMAIYTLNNAEKLGAYLTDTITGLTDDEMKILSLDPSMRSQYAALIQGGIDDLVANRSAYLAEIDDMDQAALDEFKQMFDGSHYTLGIEKKGGQSYLASGGFQLVVRDPENPSDKMDVSINTQSTLTACPSFTVAVPSTGVTTWAEVEKRMQQIMKVQTANGSYKLNKGTDTAQGTIGVKIINNSTYLQLRGVAEALDEEVNWDTGARQAYVERMGNRVDMTGTLINGRTYIKIRDFEKLGYQIQWDAKTKTVTIIKNLF